MNFSDFTDGGVPIVTDYIAGYAAAGGAGSDRRWLVGKILNTKGTPNTQTGATYTVADTDMTIIANRAGTVTLTLPTASSWTGRRLLVKTIQSQTVVSATSNVVPLIGGSAGTAILSGTAGKWADMYSDATNWIIMAGN